MALFSDCATASLSQRQEMLELGSPTTLKICVENSDLQFPCDSRELARPHIQPDGAALYLRPRDEKDWLIAEDPDYHFTSSAFFYFTLLRSRRK